MHHAREHFGFNFERLAVELKGVNGISTKGPVAGTDVGGCGTELGSRQPREKMVANEIQSRHCFRGNSSVQSVADNDAVRVQFL